jgi:hypothetical protein
MVEISIVIIISLIFLGAFSLFQDYYEVPPFAVLSYSYHFDLGIMLVVSGVVYFGVIRIRNMIKNHN